MPTYEYECPACHRSFERFQPITARPSARCPECGRPARRLISAGAGFLFKGSGFYATDHRSSSYKDQAKAETCKKSKSPRGKAGCPSGSDAK